MAPRAAAPRGPGAGQGATVRRSSAGDTAARTGTAAPPVSKEPLKNPPQYVCYLCRRKFPNAPALTRHETQSELHLQNLERQDELVNQHKHEVLARVHALREELQQLAASAADAGGEQQQQQQQRRVQLEATLRELLGELAQAQEMLERSLECRHIAEAGKRGDSGGTGLSGKRTTSHHDGHVGRLVLDAGVACWRGGKEVQEDRHILSIELKSADGHKVAGFCVLDGHSGDRCCEHLVERLPVNLQACLSSKPGLTEAHLRQAVAEACGRCDCEFLARARKEELMDGSTMILALLFPDLESRRSSGACKLMIANVGDSRAVLCRAAEGNAPTAGIEGPGLSALRLSEDHKPSRQDEQQRIQAKGGVVDFHGVWRVFVPSPATIGNRVLPRLGLAVSRAFGDLLLKEPERYGVNGVSPGGLVIAEPELHVVDLDADMDRFLILACDGIWDVLRDEDAVAISASQAGSDLAAYSVVRHAFAAGSGDNLTALIVTWRAAD